MTMKLSAIIRGGVFGGLLAAVMVATVGQMLGVSIPPWEWAASRRGYYGRAVEWGRAVTILAPIAVAVGLGAASVCAIAFEFVTRRAGWRAGAFVGLVVGTSGAAIVGLVPWFASWYGYAYMPMLAPLGRYDPFWSVAALASAGVIMGMVAGACYGPPASTGRRPRRVRWREIYPIDREVERP
jgi:hypothetical protein